MEEEHDDILQISNRSLHFTLQFSLLKGKIKVLSNLPLATMTTIKCLERFSLNSGKRKGYLQFPGSYNIVTPQSYNKS